MPTNWADLLNAMPSGAFVVDTGHCILLWNRAIAEWTQVPAAVAEGQPLGRILPRFAEPKYWQVVETSIQKPSPPTVFSPPLHRNLIQSRKPDSSPPVHRVYVSSINLSDGRPAALVTVQDISDLTRKTMELINARREVEREAERRNAAEQKLRAAGRVESLSAIATEYAHVVNNRLQTILSAAELAGDRTDEPDQVARQLAKIRAQCQDVGDMSKGLLELAREEIHNLGEVALGPIVQDVANQHAERLNTVITVSAAGGGAPHVRVNRSALEYIVQAAIGYVAQAETAAAALGLQARIAASPAPSHTVGVIVGVNPPPEGALRGTIVATVGWHGTIRLAIARQRAMRFGGDIREEMDDHGRVRLHITFPGAVASLAS